MENFIEVNLRIITWETVFQKTLRTVPPIRDQSTVINVYKTKCYTSINDVLTVYTIKIGTYKVIPYKIKKELLHPKDVGLMQMHSRH